MTKSPVLFLVFNRLETTRLVFQAIREAKPAKLYIAGDGPRLTRKTDQEKINEVRTYITNNIDWQCEVKTLFHDTNLGCKFAVNEAINWLFKYEEDGIILEDDCLPGIDFFRFCDELLLKYRLENTIMAISGTNISDSMQPVEADYFFSLIGGNWGWATWRRAWKSYKVDINADLTKENIQKFHNNLNNKIISKTLLTEIQTALNDPRICTWDYQWLFLRIINKGKSIIPVGNLISNIGFGTDSTHTINVNHPLAQLPIKSINSPLRHPKSFETNIGYDADFAKYFGANKTWKSKIYFLLKKWVEKV